MQELKLRVGLAALCRQQSHSDLATDAPCHYRWTLHTRAAFLWMGSMSMGPCARLQHTVTSLQMIFIIVKMGIGDMYL